MVEICRQGTEEKMDNNCAGTTYVEIANTPVGPGFPTYIIAEMSTNHGGDFNRAVDIIHAAKEAGADAVKLQTYTADTLTLDSDKPPFFIEGGPWGGQTMYQLYQAAFTPWEWHPRLAKIADDLGITLFSAPFDLTSVDFLEEMNVPAYKIASYELIELRLIEKVAATGKPVIMSTGEATLAEIDEAVRTALNAGAGGVVLLKCTSAYPAPPEEMNLRTIPHLQQSFGVPVGLSDHSLGIGASIAAIVLGASVIEKHFTLDDDLKTPDSFFSMGQAEFKSMVKEIRCTEKSLGGVKYATFPNPSRRSLYAIRDIKPGEHFSNTNVQSLRPGGDGLLPRFYSLIEGRRALFDIRKGTAIRWEHVGS